MIKGNLHLSKQKKYYIQKIQEILWNRKKILYRITNRDESNINVKISCKEIISNNLGTILYGKITMLSNKVENLKISICCLLSFLGFVVCNRFLKPFLWKRSGKYNFKIILKMFTFLYKIVWKFKDSINRYLMPSRMD